MDPHPTPFPGKRRPVANPTAKKEKDQPKTAASLAQSKIKRTFGRNLSGNITVERPSQKSVAAKPWKPSGVSKNTQKPPKKVSSALSCAGGAKSSSNKKAQHVTFLETPPPVEAVDESIKVSQDDLLVCTPVLSPEPLIPETPYQSAENCSKCRLDRLETSSYWLSQIKLAEPTGKHFVSAAFFRLALECKAQPFVSLQNELKHYMDRHGVVFMESLWRDLYWDYGLTSEQPDVYSGDADSINAVLVEQFDSKCSKKEDGECTVERDICVDYDLIDKPEEIAEDLEAKNDATEEIIFVKHSEDSLLELSSSMDSPLRSFQDVENQGSNSVLSGGVRRSYKISLKKSKIDDLISNDSADTRTNWSIISGKNVGQECTKNSDSKPSWKKVPGAMMGSSDMLKSTSKEEEQCTCNHLDENDNLVEDGEKVEGEESEVFNQI